MGTFEDSPLWKRTLAAHKGSDQFRAERERVRSALLSFRDRAAVLAQEISRDLPDYTVHDITHIDALWFLADLIAGERYELTPTEAFVLGGAFLIHDLGNGLAAYPEGVSTLRATPQWRDAVSMILRKKYGTVPSPLDIESADENTKKLATEQVLRVLHAQHAERLALVSWRDPDTGSERFLIEDDFLRQTYGRLIGRIAHSHWWGVERLKPEFESLIGAPVTCPSVWTVDPLKLACLLRVADAAHLDARRAPSFLKGVRMPSDYSRQHWLFQERLQQPIRDGDRLIYTSSEPFLHSEAASWWLCYDALQALDRELTGVDSVLADSNRPRLLVRAVQGAEDALRLSKWIQTDAWVPVDTRVKVTNVAELATRLGGAQLYGRDNLVPLRELIQNASDAIRARRFAEKRPVTYGSITVQIGNDADGHWIEVADNGIGMSEAIMTGPLLDFGSSFWNSERMMQELPGLASTGFESTGKYGIGFFSLFMWGKRVRVTSRNYRDASRDTKVLEFDRGLQARPILRQASPEHYLPDGGTTVRIYLEFAPESKGGIFFRPNRRRKTLEDICKWLCPAIDTDLWVQRDDTKSRVVEASDWKRISGELLLERLTDDQEQLPWVYEEEKDLIPKIATNLRTLQDSTGNIIARIAIIPQDYWGIETFGAVTAGGFRACELRRIAGIITGVAATASRKYAIPVVEPSTLAEWATGQTRLLEAMKLDDSTRAYVADTISRCGGEIGRLPIAEVATGWLSAKKIATLPSLPDEIILVDATDIENIRTDFGDLELAKSVFACQAGTSYFLDIPYEEKIDWPEPEYSEDKHFVDRSNRSRVARLLADRWGASLQEVMDASDLSRSPKFFYRKIGTIKGQSIDRSVDILRNPHPRHARKRRRKK